MSKARQHVLVALVACLLLGLASPFSQAASQQQIQQLRSLSYTVVDNILVFHNPLGVPYDIANAQAYQQALQQLMQQAQALGLSDVSAQVQRLNTAVADLQHLPQNAADSRSNIPAFRQWLPQVIEQQGQLLVLLDERYRQANGGNPEQQALHQLSRDLQRLSLHYQLNAFVYLAVPTWMLDETQLSALDASVQQRLAQLPGGDGNLDKLAARYHFVRGYLLKPGEGWAPNAVQRYLASSAAELDSAAARLAL